MCKYCEIDIEKKNKKIITDKEQMFDVLDKILEREES